MIHLGVRFAVVGHHAVEPLAVPVQRAGDIAGHHLAVVIARFHQHLAPELFLGTLGDQVDDATGGTLPVEHGGRPFEDLHPLEGVLIGPGAGVAAEGGLQAVDEDRRCHPADLGPVAARVHTVKAAVHAGEVLKRLLNGLGTDGIHKLPGTQGNGERRFGDRHVHLADGGLPGQGHLLADDDLLDIQALPLGRVQGGRKQ